MDIRKKAVNPTGTLHLRDAADVLMYNTKQNDKGEAVDDLARPVQANLFGPGSKEYARATTWQTNQFMNRIKKKGKTDQTPEEKAEETATFLTMITHSWENMEHGEFTSDGASPKQMAELSKTIYMDQEVGFIGDQISGYVKEWGNFLKESPTT